MNETLQKLSAYGFPYHLPPFIVQDYFEMLLSLSSSCTPLTSKSTLGFSVYHISGIVCLRED